MPNDFQVCRYSHYGECASWRISIINIANDITIYVNSGLTYKQAVYNPEGYINAYRNLFFSHPFHCGHALYLICVACLLSSLNSIFSITCLFLISETTMWESMARKTLRQQTEIKIAVTYRNAFLLTNVYALHYKTLIIIVPNGN